MASLRFRPAVLLEARARAQLTQLKLAILADEATREDDTENDHSADGARRIRTWESRIGAWERGIDQPSATVVPILARLLDVHPLALFEVDPASPPITALRVAAGFTLQGLADATGVSYTTLHRMMRGVTGLPDGTADRLATTLGVSRQELLAAIARDG